MMLFVVYVSVCECWLASREREKERVREVEEERERERKLILGAARNMFSPLSVVGVRSYLSGTGDTVVAKAVLTVRPAAVESRQPERYHAQPGPVYYS